MIATSIPKYPDGIEQQRQLVELIAQKLSMDTVNSKIPNIRHDQANQAVWMSMKLVPNFTSKYNPNATKTMPTKKSIRLKT